MIINKHKGQSIIEVALIFPLLFFLLLGFFDLGRAIFYYASLSHAVREVSRTAIVSNVYLSEARILPENNVLVDLVKEKAIGLNKESFTNISVTPEPNVGSFKTVTVSAEYFFDPITPGIQLIFGDDDGIVLRAESRMWVAPGSQ
jgi:Flp pilus assembly protein TadG